MKKILVAIAIAATVSALSVSAFAEQSQVDDGSVGKIFEKTASANILAPSGVLPDPSEEIMPGGALIGSDIAAIGADEETKVPAENSISSDIQGSVSPSFVGNADTEANSDIQPQRANHGDTGTGSIEDINKYWEENGYPDDISFAFNAGGEMLGDGSIQNWIEIGVINATDERKQEILSLVAPSCSVEFIDCVHSYAEKKAAYDELLTLADDRITDIVFTNNDDHVLIFFKTELTIDEYKAYANELRQKYGTVLQVADPYEYAGAPEGGYDVGMGVLTGATGIEKKSDYTLWIVISCAAVFISTIAVLLIMRSKSQAKQTADGTIISGDATISSAQVKKSIKESEFTPSDELFERISDELKK